MYDFYDGTGHHHGSQYKQNTAYKKADPKPSLGTSSTSSTFWLTLTLFRYIGINFGQLYSFGLWTKILKTQNNLLDKCLIQFIANCMDVVM